MKRLVSFALVLAMALTLTACGAKEEAPAPAPEKPATSAPAPAAPSTSAPEDPYADLEPITIILGDAVAATEEGTQAGMAFAEEVNKRTNGKITIDYKAGGQLGTGDEMTEAMAMGQLDMARLDFTYFASYCPEAQMMFQPFLVNSYEHFDRLLDSEGIKKVEETMEGYNITILDYVTAGFRVLTSKVPITKISDCKDILLRSPGADMYLNIFNTLGFSPVVVAYTEVYNALESGICDGVDNSLVTVCNEEHYKITPYVLNARHMMSFTQFCVNTEFWNSLPQAYRDVITEVLNEKCAEQRANDPKVQQGFFDKMAADGATINEWDNFDELVNLFSPKWEEFANEVGGFAPEFLAEIQELA